MQSFRATKTDRLDRILRSVEFPGSVWMSRAAWDEAISQGRVRINGRLTKKGGVTVAETAEITLDLPALGLLPAAEPASLVWASPTHDIAIFNKPAGIATYPLFPWEEGTFAHRICRFAEQEGWLKPSSFESLSPAPILEAGLLQRLDRDTTGLIACAFTGFAKARYRPIFSGAVKKGYFALAANAPGLAGSHPLHFRQSEQAAVLASREEKNGTLPATLHVKLLAHTPAYALVEVETTQGMRHVVRAGMAALGAPLVGDVLYGGAALAPHHQLHAAWMELPAQARVAVDPPQSFLDCAASLGLR
jgi:23S rRNA pseudouridine1911/1915/1917 synthase